jgi:predicted DNA-binding ribbon-helix-helix protein
MTIELPPLSPPVKRSLTIDGHATSISLEDAFWRAAAEAAAARGMTRAQLIAAIDHARPPEVGLATAVRLFVLAEVARCP